MPPCEGGVTALNGTNGNILWRRWMNDTIFSLTCSADVNGDDLFDCLVVGYNGVTLYSMRAYKQLYKKSFCFRHWVLLIREMEV